MAFDAKLEIINGVAKISLSGELDAATSPLLKEKVEEAAKQKVRRLVLLAQDLKYMASAGLRVLIFSKQKMGTDVDIYVVGAQKLILETLDKTGFAKSVIIVNEYP
ncbi:MAG: anti-sigma factor antagonist [Snowella sp.]|nr:anti-sigma factor antagonist [Snowella sp.]